MLLLSKAQHGAPCAGGSGEGKPPAGDEETETLDANKQKGNSLAAGAGTEQNLGRQGLLRRKSGSEALNNTVGIPGADDTKTEKFLFIQTQGSNLSVDAYCLRSIYFCDAVIMCIGL